VAKAHLFTKPGLAKAQGRLECGTLGVIKLENNLEGDIYEGYNTI
jgi:hypothetical protein